MKHGELFGIRKFRVNFMFLTSHAKLFNEIVDVDPPNAIRPCLNVVATMHSANVIPVPTRRMKCSFRHAQINALIDETSRFTTIEHSLADCVKVAAVALTTIGYSISIWQLWSLKVFFARAPHKQKLLHHTRTNRLENNNLCYIFQYRLQVVAHISLAHPYVHVQVCEYLLLANKNEKRKRNGRHNECCWSQLARIRLHLSAERI